MTNTYPQLADPFAALNLCLPAICIHKFVVSMQEWDDSFLYATIHREGGMH